MGPISITIVLGVLSAAGLAYYCYTLYFAARGPSDELPMHTRDSDYVRQVEVEQVAVSTTAPPPPPHPREQAYAPNQVAYAPASNSGGTGGASVAVGAAAGLATGLAAGGLIVEANGARNNAPYDYNNNEEDKPHDESRTPVLVTSSRHHWSPCSWACRAE